MNKKIDTLLKGLLNAFRHFDYSDNYEVGYISKKVENAIMKNKESTFEKISKIEKKQNTSQFTY